MARITDRVNQARREWPAKRAWELREVGNRFTLGKFHSHLGAGGSGGAGGAGGAGGGMKPRKAGGANR